MKLKDIFTTAGANLLRSKLRTSLTIMAIFIGAFTLTITSGMGSGISAYIDDQLGNLGAENVLLIRPASNESGMSEGPQKYDPTRTAAAPSGPISSGTVLTQEDITKLKQNSQLTSVAPLLLIAADYIEGRSEYKYQLMISPSISGTTLNLAAGQNLDNSTNQLQLILPINYVEPLGYISPDAAVGQTVILGVTSAEGELRTVEAMVVGVQEKGLLGEGGAMVNQELNQALYDIQSQGLPTAARERYQVISAEYGEISESELVALKSDLQEQGYLAETVQDRIGLVKTVIAGIISVLNAFAVIALLAASFGIINTLLMAVQERTKEIGLMKSMGMSSRRIFLLFSAEAIMIGFWGSLLGVIVAFAAGTVASNILANGLLKDLPGLQIVAFPPLSIALIMLLIMTIAFLAGTLPARRAAKLNPIDALRYE